MGSARTFLRYLNAQPKLVLKPSLLVLIPFLASVPLYVPNARIMRDMAGDTVGIGSLVVAMAATCLVLSVALALYAAKNPHWAGFGRPIQSVASGGYIVSLAAVWVLELNGNGTVGALVGLGVALGSCSMPVVMAWIARYAMDVRNVMLYGALSCIGASLLSWGLSLLPAVPSALIAVACGAIGSVAPVVSARGGEGSEYRGSVDDSSGWTGAEEGSNGPETGFGGAVRNLLSVIWLPLLGFLLCMFISTSCEFTLGGITLRSEFIGGAIASAIAIALCLARRKTPFVLLIDKLVVPALVAVAVVLGGFPADSSPFFLGASLIFVPMMFLSLFALASLVAIAAAGEFSLPFVFGAAFFSSNLVTLLGLAAGGGLIPSDDIGPVLWVMLCAYFAVVIMHLGYTSWRQLVGPRDDEGLAVSQVHVDAESLEAYRHRRIERLADDCGLTNRERELLDYLSRGYGSSFIAKTLFISDNTARTHIRNIYRKLGVSSREQLLSLFNEDACEVQRTHGIV